MRFSTMIVGAFAALTAAAPVTVAADQSPADLMVRNTFDRQSFNNLKFNSRGLGYIFGQNQFDLNFIDLLVQQNFNAQIFQQVFNQQFLSANSLFLFGQATCLQQVHGAGLFNGFNLAALNFGGIGWGILGDFSGFNLESIIDVNIFNQVGDFGRQNPNIVVIQ